MAAVPLSRTSGRPVPAPCTLLVRPAARTASCFKCRGVIQAPCGSLAAVTRSVAGDDGHGCGGGGEGGTGAGGGVPAVSGTVALRTSTLGVPLDLVVAVGDRRISVALHAVTSYTTGVAHVSGHSEARVAGARAVSKAIGGTTHTGAATVPFVAFRCAVDSGSGNTSRSALLEIHVMPPCMCACAPAVEQGSDVASAEWTPCAAAVAARTR